MLKAPDRCRQLERVSVSMSVMFVLAVVVSVVGCRFSFAESKKAERGSITFGAEKKPEVGANATLAGFKTVFADVAEKVIPTVVSITATKNDTIVYQDPFNFFFGFPFDPFFDQDQQAPRNRRAPQRGPQRQIIPQQGVGSGVIVSSEGHILTNYHVVGDADAITVKLSDGRSFDATVVGSDSLSDVAVIKLKEKVKELPVAYLGDSDKLRPGDWAMAIGTPFNLASTVTVGIVSAINRTEATEGKNMYRDFIQTDAAINPGNSGGALVNIDGEVVGINTLIYSRTGGYMGIGFAIPINMARRIMEDLIYEGKVSRGWLGVQIQDVNPAMRDALGLGDQKGVMISDVFKGEPAEKAGLKRGDIVLSVNGKDVANVNQLRNAVAAVRPGVATPIVILRGGKKMTLEVKLTERKEDRINKLAGSEEKAPEKSDSKMLEKLGLKVGSLTAEMRQQLNAGADVQGVVIIEVAPNSQAAQEGLQEKDIIREVNQKPITSLKDFNEAVKGFKAGSPALFLIQREGRTFFVAFKIKE